MKKIEPISFPKSEIHYKKWGQADGIGEVWIVNNDKYCLKILKFGAGKAFSLHLHCEKEETWLVTEGELTMKYFNLQTAEEITKTLISGDIVSIPPGNPHQLKAITNSTIYEISTTHAEFDSYRIAPGDSQK